MTDTTYIKALRRRSNNLRTADQTDAFIDLLLDQLEAERQRADEGDKSAKYSAATNKRVVAANCRLQEELAALKGDQVPVGEIVAWSHPKEERNVDFRFLRFDVNPGAQLFAAPQKPVVLLPKFTDRHTCMNSGCDAAAAYKEDIIAMNKAAGGIVKDGD